MMFLQCCRSLAVVALALAATVPVAAAEVKKAGRDAIVEAALPKTDTLVVIATGDGGWWGDFDTKLGERFAARGDAVVGLDTAIYFDGEKTPAEWGAKLAGIVDTYTAATGATRVVLLGWSYGADVIPFGYAAMPDQAKAKVAGIVLLAPRQHTNLSITISGRLGLDRGTYAAADVYGALPLDRTVCVKPEGEDDTGCDLPVMAGATVLTLPGGHDFGRDAEAITADVLAALGLGDTPAARE
jgi:type IV secretory pathway VirJ component